MNIKKQSFAGGDSSMVEQSTHDHVFEGLNPAEAIIGQEEQKKDKSQILKNKVLPVAIAQW
jgi:hypothetical protein